MAKNKLKDMFVYQRYLEYMGYDLDFNDMSDDVRRHTILDFARHCGEELLEVIDELAPHYEGVLLKRDEKYIQEECIDVLTLAINLCLAVGLDNKTTFEMFVNKNKVNWSRATGFMVI